MSAGRYVLIALLLLPAAELVVFFAFTSLIGFLPAVALAAAASLFGLATVRRDGLRRVSVFTRAAAAPVSALELQAANLVVLAGGCLLLLPGFLTDLMGLALLLAPRAISRRILPHLLGSFDRDRSDAVVELDRSEWQRVPERRMEDRGARHPNS